MTAELFDAQASFALDLLRNGADENQPSIMSPFSVAIALAMTYAGADGKTKEQLNQALAKGFPDSEIHEHFAELIKELSKVGNDCTLSTANRLYVDKGFPLEDDYTAKIKSKYAGQLRAEDFSHAAAVVKEINEWVEKQTNSKIKNLVSEDVINPASRLVLINAVYFKGDWAKKFSEAKTKKKPFHVSANEHREVDMMAINDQFHYTQDDDWQMLGLPYKNGAAFMCIFLPREKFTLANKLKALDGKRLLETFADCDKMKVEVELPKFKLEKQFQLVETLKKLGIHDAFDESVANFSGISKTPLSISGVVHKAFIEVNEEGSEAAAATAAIMVMRCAPAMPREPIRFIADHPFMFAIIRYQTILFIGTYY